MEKKAIFRRIMLAAGFLAAVVILLSTSFSSVDVTKESAKKKTEQGAEDAARTFVSAPSEAIPGSAVQVENPTPSCFEVLLDNEEEESGPEVHCEELTRYLKVLFRTIISPNAP